MTLACFKYVSIEATTIRASSVTRLMLATDISIHASTTMPLSSTRSSTSIMFAGPDGRSRCIGHGILHARVTSLAGVVIGMSQNQSPYRERALVRQILLLFPMD